MTKSLDSRRQKARHLLGPGATDEVVDDLVRSRMATTIGVRNSLALQAAEDGALYFDEKALPLSDLIELKLIKLSGDFWVLTSQGRELMRARRESAHLRRDVVITKRDALKAAGFTDEQIKGLI